MNPNKHSSKTVAGTIRVPILLKAYMKVETSKTMSSSRRQTTSSSNFKGKNT